MIGCLVNKNPGMKIQMQIKNILKSRIKTMPWQSGSGDQILWLNRLAPEYNICSRKLSLKNSLSKFKIPYCFGLRYSGGKQHGAD